jgi:hypothetical protein
MKHVLPIPVALSQDMSCLLQHTKEDLARCMSDFEEKKKRETELS